MLMPASKDGRERGRQQASRCQRPASALLSFSFLLRAGRVALPERHTIDLLTSQLHAPLSEIQYIAFTGKDMFWREPFNLTEAVANCNTTWGVTPSRLKAQTEWGGRRIEAASNIVVRFREC